MTAFQHSAKIQLDPYLPVTFDLYVRGDLDNGRRVGRTVLSPTQFSKLGKCTLYMSMDKSGVPDAGLEIEVHSSSLAEGVCADPSPVSPSAPQLAVLSEGPELVGVQAYGGPGVQGCERACKTWQALRIPDSMPNNTFDSCANVWRRFFDIRGKDFNLIELLKSLTEPRTPRGHGIHDLVVDIFRVGRDSLTWTLACYNANTGDYQTGMAFSPNIPEPLREKCHAMRSSLSALGVGASYPQDVMTMYQATDKLLAISADDGTLLYGPMLMHAFQFGGYKFAEFIPVEVENYETPPLRHPPF